MTFSDDDMKRLKAFAECGDPTGYHGFSPEAMRALLARLEAAERVIDNIESNDSSMAIDRSLGLWRKAAGK